MATPELQKPIAANIRTPAKNPHQTIQSGRYQTARGSILGWMALDAITVLFATTAATIIDFHISPIHGARSFVHNQLIRGETVGVLTALLVGFIAVLILVNRSLLLYSPVRLASHLHEQRLSLQACVITTLMLMGALYLLHAEMVPRRIVLISVLLITAGLALRRAIFRIAMYHRFERGLNTRNVIIVGLGSEALALRHHLKNIPQLGFVFKGFVYIPGVDNIHEFSMADDLLGPLEQLFDFARQHFVDEIFFTAVCERSVINQTLQRAQENGIDLRVVPDLYDGLAWSNNIEYIGQFPTIPLHRSEIPEVALVLKRIFDFCFSGCVLAALSPVMLLIALAIKLDSQGPIFYLSERIGRKGNVFRCIKFRTMIQDAERRRAELMHMNEREGILFKLKRDPRVTRVGAYLRKYSLDELPQFFNVLNGTMSIVGPRPPLVSEVRQYQLSHLRRLDVTPGITGLWQVQARQDPSFDSYISLDVSYIENWSLWLDLKIILRTIGVVFAGTGS